MAKSGVWREIVVENTLSFSKIYKHLDNHYDLNNFMSICLVFTYDGYIERGGDKKSEFSRRNQNFVPMSQI